MSNLRALILLLIFLSAGVCKGQADSVMFETRSNLILRNIFYAGFPAKGRMIGSNRWLLFKPDPSSKREVNNRWIKDLPMKIEDIRTIRRNWLILWPFKLRIKMKNGRVYKFGMYGQRKGLIDLVRRHNKN